MCVCSLSGGILRGWKWRPQKEARRGQYTPKPELKASVLAMGSELGPPARAVHALTTELSLQPHVLHFNRNNYFLLSSFESHSVLWFKGMCITAHYGGQRTACKSWLSSPTMCGSGLQAQRQEEPGPAEPSRHPLC